MFTFPATAEIPPKNVVFKATGNSFYFVPNLTVSSPLSAGQSGKSGVQFFPLLGRHPFSGMCF